MGICVGNTDVSKVISLSSDKVSVNMNPLSIYLRKRKSPVVSLEVEFAEGGCGDEMYISGCPV